MKHKHYFLLLLIVTILLVSCPVNHSSPTPPPSKPVAPQEPSAPTADVDGDVAEADITAWKNALSALVHCPANGNVNNIYQETIALREFLVDTDVVIEATPNNIPVTYYKGSYVSQTMNNKESNKSTGLMEVSGKYKDSGTSFKVYVNGSSEYNPASSQSTFTGTATYTEGSTPYKFDANIAFSGAPITDKNSPEYKASLLMNNMPFAENGHNLDATKTTFTNYSHTDGYIFDGETAGVEKVGNTFVSDQEYTDGEVSVTIPNEVEQDGVKLIVRYDIKREGESKTITDTSYMHVKRVGDEKFKVFPLDQLTI